MKKLTVLLFSVLISFNSYGEWMKFVEHPDGYSFYIDRDAIKEHKGYVYYWDLTDYLTPNEYGTMSGKVYKQVDCGVNRYKPLSFTFYKQPMGGGSGKTEKPYDTDWRYPSPDTIAEGMLKYVCDYVK